jgi:hypothetical protein
VVVVTVLTVAAVGVVGEGPVPAELHAPTTRGRATRDKVIRSIACEITGS